MSHPDVNEEYKEGMGLDDSLLFELDCFIDS